MRIICWIIGLWKTITIGMPIDGCDYFEVGDVEIEGRKAQRLQCKRCGEISDGFY